MQNINRYYQTIIYKTKTIIKHIITLKVIIAIRYIQKLDFVCAFEIKICFTRKKCYDDIVLVEATDRIG